VDSPDFNPDEAIWELVRKEVRANTCFGTAAKVRQKVDAFFVGLPALPFGPRGALSSVGTVALSSARGSLLHLYHFVVY
jgi:hypothetical protein